MKRLAKILLLLIVICMAGLVALPFIIPAETLKTEALAQLKKHTGRDVTIEGDIALSVFPNITLRLSGVTVSNAAGFTKPYFARIGELSLDVSLLPLLSKQVEINSFSLQQPSIWLERDGKGKENWVFSNASSAPNGNATKGDAAGGVTGIKAGDISIEDGEIGFLDRQAGKEYQISALNVSVESSRMDAPLAVKGDAEWRSKNLAFAFDVENVQALLDGDVVKAVVNLTSDDLSVRYDGTVQQGKDIKLAGKVDVNSPSLRALQAWLEGTPRSEGAPLALKLAGGVSGDMAALSLADVIVVLDGIEGSGSLSVDRRGSIPKIAGKLALGDVDITPLMGAPKAKTGNVSTATPTERWSRAPLDLSALKSVNVDFALSMEGVNTGSIKLGKTAMKLVVQGGKLVATLEEMALYGGMGKGKITLNVNGTPQVEKQFSLVGVQAAPLLKDAITFEKLEGTANADIHATATGKNMAQMVESLAGNGKVIFTDGAIRGINIAAMARNIGTAFANNASEKTDFAELSGSFTISKGVVQNNDLAMKAPLLRVTGKGTADLPNWRVNYRLVPELVASLKGQGGKEKEGVAIPIIIEGALDKPSFRPDLKSMVEEGLKDPEKIKNTVKNVEETVKENRDQIKNLLKGF